MRNQFLHTVGIHVTDLSCTEAVKIALYMVLLSDVDGNIVLLPVRVIPCIKYTNQVVNTRVYSSAANSIQRNYILNFACDFYSCSRLQR